MKKTLSIFSLLTLVSSVVFAGGIEDPKASSTMAMMKKDNKHVKVFYKGRADANVQISIFDSNNNLKYSEVVRNKDGFSRPYDLSYLKGDEYTIEVKDGVNTLVETLNTKEVKSTFLSQVIKLQGQENQFLVMATDKEASSLFIRIEDENGNVLKEHADVMDQQYAKLFKFSDTCKNCTFIISNGKGEVLAIKK